MNTKGPVPWHSVWALLAMPALGVLSIPFWIWWVDYEMARGPRARFAADPGMYRAFGVVFPTLLTALAGCIPGVWLLRVAQRKNEPLRGIWWLALLLNGAGLYYLLSFVCSLWFFFSKNRKEIKEHFKPLVSAVVQRECPKAG